MRGDGRGRVRVGTRTTLIWSESGPLQEDHDRQERDDEYLLLPPVNPPSSVSFPQSFASSPSHPPHHILLIPLFSLFSSPLIVILLSSSPLTLLSASIGSIIADILGPFTYITSSPQAALNKTAINSSEFLLQ